MAETEPIALRERLLDGLERLSSVMRADVRRSAAQRGLNPAQDAILRLLLARPAGVRVSGLALHLGVSQPSITDSVIALERKGLVDRQPDPEDARAVVVKTTPNARPQEVTDSSSYTAAALADLSELRANRGQAMRDFRLATNYHLFSCGEIVPREHFVLFAERFTSRVAPNGRRMRNARLKPAFR